MSNVKAVWNAKAVRKSSVGVGLYLVSLHWNHHNFFCFFKLDQCRGVVQQNLTLLAMLGFTLNISRNTKPFGNYFLMDMQMMLY